MKTYFVINLEDVTIEKKHPYTLVFTGYIPTYGGNKLFTFKYDGSVQSDFSMADDIKEDFENQLRDDYKFGFKFDKESVKKQLMDKQQYRMEMK